MRIDELDPKHKEFKQIILNHDLTEEQLDEIAPIIGAVAGGVARGAAAAGQLAARGAGAVARGVGSVARGVGQAATSLARGVGGMAKTAGQNIKQGAKKQVQKQVDKKVQSLKKDTANKLSNLGGAPNNQNNQNQQPNQQTQNQQTIGSQGSQNQQQAKLQRGQQVNVPVGNQELPMKIKNVSSSEIEFEPTKRQPGMPASVKFNKKDLGL